MPLLNGLTEEQMVWVVKLFNKLKSEVYNRQLCNLAHDFEHIRRGVIRFSTWLPLILADDPTLKTKLNSYQVYLDYLCHDLNRSRKFRIDEPDKALRRKKEHNTRIDYIRLILRDYAHNNLVETVIGDVENHHLDDAEDESIEQRFKNDIDKADMGAIGIARMFTIAAERQYGITGSAVEFQFDIQASGADEDIESGAADVKWCYDWWRHPKFGIKNKTIRRLVESRFAFLYHFSQEMKQELITDGLLSPDGHSVDWGF